jgi:hypothetical protein
VIDSVLQFPTNKAGAPEGSIRKTAGGGLQIRPVGGGTYDFLITDAAETAHALGVKTGTANVLFGGVPDFSGGTSGTAGSLVGYINVMVGGTARRIPYYAT